MSDIVYIHQKYKEITGNVNADDVPVYAMKKVVKAYEKGRKDAIKEIISYMQEYSMIDCNCCTENNRCDRDCWDVITEQLKEQTQ